MNHQKSLNCLWFSRLSPKRTPRLAIIDEEIAKLRETLKQLEEDRASLLSYKVILSPLRRMPPEVLGQIFSWTLPSVDDE
ncbi:hypothetical protein DFH06DRAFT_986571 [Mycena polygramma]|nr:hypothetical protein DFH06DRAFT_986571 [Mycena polygramma]